MLQITELQAAAGLGSHTPSVSTQPWSVGPRTTGWAAYCTNSLRGCRLPILIWIMVPRR